MRISDWSSDVCSSDLRLHPRRARPHRRRKRWERRVSNRLKERGEDDVWASRRRHPTARPVPTQRPPKLFTALLGVIAALNMLGLVMVMSASSVSALDLYGSSWYIVMRQAMWLVIGAFACVVVVRVDYHRWRRWSRSEEHTS